MHEDLMEQVVEEENLERALRAVERKRGAAGIDKMTTQEASKARSSLRVFVVARRG